MGKAQSGESIRCTTGCESIKGAAGAAGFLSVAASPTFAVMALLTGAGGAGVPDMVCSATHHAISLNGMTVMYLLMSAFHSAPWLRLVARRLNRVRGNDEAGSSHGPALDLSSPSAQS